MDRDKTKEYINEYEKFSIVTFWQEEIPKVAQAGWCHKVIDKKQ
nr:hypothetical protein [uncultured archaeon]